MQTVVHKFIFPQYADEGTFAMSGSATILHAGMQGKDFCIWARVPMDDSTKYLRRFIIRGTGHTIPEGPYVFISTIITEGGSFVFHIFEDMSWVGDYVRAEYEAMPQGAPVILQDGMRVDHV